MMARIAGPGMLIGILCGLMTMSMMAAEPLPFDDLAQYEAQKARAEAQLRDFDTLVVRPLILRRDCIRDEYAYKTERPPVLRKQIVQFQRQRAGLLAEIKACPPQIARARQQSQARLQSITVEASRAAELEARGLTKDAKKARDRAAKSRTEAKKLARKANEVERKQARKERQLARKQAQLDDLKDELNEIVNGQPTRQQLQLELQHLETRLGDLERLREEKQKECELWKNIVHLCREYRHLTGH